MDASINAMVSMSSALQQANAMQEAQAGLLNEVLDTQAASVNQLMDSVKPTAELATSGSLGTQINTYA
ncbi:putative motility protein [Larsenimonas rhizosphaerae]|uniref:Motility protein n=1 Tax=Larsenimonas rhizosphaerae TaxID=2944682 RepID=A0AA42CT96_9GAMM|nr:putative motility protein [Larsenimonas rhizosphaerae]MCM2130245.1 putative motility protein [Larsenimonas rhizosphaerae]MCX2522949.1 putative motility protein [Larsenimonas rhizosphaerae]